MKKSILLLLVIGVMTQQAAAQDVPTAPGVITPPTTVAPGVTPTTEGPTNVATCMMLNAQLAMYQLYEGNMEGQINLLEDEIFRIQTTNYLTFSEWAEGQNRIVDNRQEILIIKFNLAQMKINIQMIEWMIAINGCPCNSCGEDPVIVLPAIDPLFP